MNKSDTAKTFYNVMCSEVIEHIKLRDQALFLYLGVAGVIFGIGFSEDNLRKLLMIIPFLGLGTAFILNQHDIHIGAICAYLTKELNEFLSEDGDTIVQWDDSIYLARIQPYLSNLRCFGHLTIILLPILVGMAGNYNRATSLSVEAIFWWGGFIAMIVTVYMIIKTYLLRNKLRK